MSLQTKKKTTRMVTSQTQCRTQYTKAPLCWRAIHTALLSYIFPLNYLMQYHWNISITYIPQEIFSWFGVSIKSYFDPANSRTWTEYSMKNYIHKDQEEKMNDVRKMKNEMRSVVEVYTKVEILPRQTTSEYPSSRSSESMLSWDGKRQCCWGLCSNYVKIFS
jgi:hypothetical protein